MYRAASELVNRAVDSALNSIASDSCTHLLTTTLSANECTLDSAGQLLTTEMLNDEATWPLEQVISELSHAAQEQSSDLKWQQMTGTKSSSPDYSQECAKSRFLPGGAYSMSEAFQSGPETESYPQMPIGMTGELVRAEQHPWAGFSCEGAHARALTGESSTEGTQHDSTTTDGELEHWYLRRRAMCRRLQMLIEAQA